MPSANQQFTLEAIGTAWQIDLYDVPTNINVTALRQTIIERIAAFDAVYSRFREDSLVGLINQAPGIYRFPEDANELMTVYRRLYDATDGAVTPLIGSALVDAGYDATYSLQPKPIRPVSRWDDVMRYGAGQLQTSQPVVLDFGAAGKGYLVDIICQLIEAAGVGAYCVDASGDLYYKGVKKALKIGLEHPDDATLVIGQVELQGGALCGSAGNRRAWQGMHHIIDPMSRQPVSAVKAVWVVAEDTIWADGIATALFFVTPERLSALPAFEFVIMKADGQVAISRGFPGRLFTEQD